MTQHTADFSSHFSQFVGGAQCFPFWKARVALYAILRGLGVGPGEEVLVPGYTCVMNVNPVKYLGARPIYIDINPSTYNIDLAQLEDAITPQTRAIMAQHTYGIPCDMDAVLEIGRRHRIPIIEDCCLALGSKYKGRLCGTMGVAAYWSFQWNKTMTTGIGGMAATCDRELSDKIRHLCEGLQSPPRRAAALLHIQRQAYRCLIYPKTTAFATSLFHWLTAKGVVIGSSASQEFVPVQGPDFFMEMSSGQAEAGIQGLGDLEQNFEHRRKIVKVYESTLQEAARALPKISVGSEPVYTRYPVRVRNKEAVLKESSAQRLEIGSWFESPLHPSKTPLSSYDYTLGQCPEAEKAAREVVNLPTHQRVSVDEAKRSVRFIKGHLVDGM